MNAVYARQSADKRDSISVESQIDICARDIGDQPYRIYADKGFSGKNTNRPQFKCLIEDIKSGEVSGVYVYKIDRISRAILDFGKIMELFDKYSVEFVSHTERFDTSTPMGKAMLNIIMVFAQLERETIQQRVTDNYYSRGEKGFYLGGYAPFGYTKTECLKNGKKTYCYKKNESESVIIREIYTAYGIAGKSMNLIARELNERGICTRRNGRWSQSSVSRILRSPVYVRADAEVYEYLNNVGAHINNPISDYTGENGCYIYGSTKNKPFGYITLGEHEGIISPDLWLNVQRKINVRQKHSNGGTGSLSWLQGLVKCRCCGYSSYVKSYSGGQRYFYCRGKRNGVCKASRKMMRCDMLEAIAENIIKDQINLLDGIKISEEAGIEINSLKIRISEAEAKIKRLVRLAEELDEVSMEYINEELKALDYEKTAAEDELETVLDGDGESFDGQKMIRLFDESGVEIKKRIVSVIIDIIHIDGNDVDIYLN